MGSRNKLEQIPLEKLLFATMERKKSGYRIAQICCAFVDNRYELSYSFAKEYHFITYRIFIRKEAQVPSITSIYPGAFLYENEMKELFGVNMEYIEPDYHDKLYRIQEETPFMEKKEEE